MLQLLPVFADRGKAGSDGFLLVGTGREAALSLLAGGAEVGEFNLVRGEGGDRKLIVFGACLEIIRDIRDNYP